MKDENTQLIKALTTSQLYRDYEKAFEDSTGLPVAIRPVESWQLPHHGKRNESPFCAMMAGKSRSCAACLQVQQKLAETAAGEAKTVSCLMGMVDTAVPLKIGNRLIGFLQTGQVFRSTAPSEAQFGKVKKQMTEWGLEVEETALRDAYFGTRVLGYKQYEAMVKLLTIFAQHVSMLSNQIVVQQTNAEPPAITKAKAYINQNHAEDLSLGEVAKAVNTSTFYFCKMFKKATGVNFTDYVSRVRIEKAKNLLLNRNLRISEIAYEIGFQSLTHFNRVFKRVAGISPTAFREKLPRATV